MSIIGYNSTYTDVHRSSMCEDRLYGVETSVHMHVCFLFANATPGLQYFILVPLLVDHVWFIVDNVSGCHVSCHYFEHCSGICFCFHTEMKLALAELQVAITQEWNLPI